MATVFAASSSENRSGSTMPILAMGPDSLGVPSRSVSARMELSGARGWAEHGFAEKFLAEAWGPAPAK